MEQKKEKAKKPLWFAVIAALAAGAVMVTTTGLQREGVRVQQYSELEAKSYCTVLVYMDGSDLESDYGAAAEDLQEMEQAVRASGMETDTLRVVVEAGGAENWKYDAMQGKDYGRFCISREGLTHEEEMEARNMGDADTLADFINYGVQSYPAEHYGLVLWNHGAGQIVGFGRDNQFGDASLPLESIRRAMEKSAMKSPFDFISLDACLMGNLELVSLLQDKAEYMIASEELEPQNGYDYRWMSAVGEQRANASDAFGRAVGEAMLSSYESGYTEKDYKLTLALIDVDAYLAFHETFHQILGNVVERTDESLYQAFGKLRKGLQSFGSRQDGMTAEIVDVMDLLEILGGLQEDQTLYQQAEGQFQKLVPSKVTKGYMEEPSGLSIYLPSGSNEWLQNDMEIYDALTFCKSYRALLRSYRDYLLKETKREWRTPSRDKKSIRLEIEPEIIEEISGAYLMVFCKTDKGVSYLLGTDSDVTINRNGFLESVPTDTYWGLKGQPLCLIEMLNMAQYTEYYAPVLYNGELCVIHIGFGEEHPDGMIQTVAPIGVEKQEYELQEGDTIVPLYPLEDAVEERGDIYDNTYYMGEPVSIDSLENGDAALELVAIENDNCSYGFLLQDTRQQLSYTPVCR